MESIYFLETVKKVNILFHDRILEAHFDRMAGGNYLAHYNSLNGEEKALVRLHELTEILSFKWDCGRDFFDKHVHKDFHYAHGQAVKVENLYMLIKAREMGISLNITTLEYFRLIDETHLITATFVSDENQLKNAIAILKKNHKILPSFEQMESYVKYMSESGIQANLGKSNIYKMVWTKYFFTILYHKFESNQNYAKVILFLLSYYQRNEIFDKHPPQELLERLEKALSEIDIQEIEFQFWNFFKDMEYVSRNEKQWFSHFILKLLNDLGQ